MLIWIGLIVIYQLKTSLSYFSVKDIELRCCLTPAFISIYSFISVIHLIFIYLFSYLLQSNKTAYQRWGRWALNAIFLHVVMQSVRAFYASFDRQLSSLSHGENFVNCKFLQSFDPLPTPTCSKRNCKIASVFCCCSMFLHCHSFAVYPDLQVTQTILMNFATTFCWKISNCWQTFSTQNFWI